MRPSGSLMPSNKRQNTLRVTMQAILHLQEAYFLTGDETQLQAHDPQRHCGTH